MKQERKESIKIGVTFIVLIAALIGFSFALGNANPKIENGHLIRFFDELQIEEFPKDFFQTPYKSNLPEIIKQDINTIISSNEDIDIKYYSQDKPGASCITIEKDDKGENGVSIEGLSNNVSIYKSGENIILFGSNTTNMIDINALNSHSIYGFTNGRILTYYVINPENKHLAYDFDSSSEKKICMDLIGSGENYYSQESIFEGEYEDFSIIDRKVELPLSFECDTDQPYEMTLVRDENRFRLYRLGKILYETYFPGEEIEIADYHYIEDSNNDLYYMYYSREKDNPWIKFVKVAENIDNIENQVIIVDDFKDETFYQQLPFYIYQKNGKRYAAIPNLQTEAMYGQFYGYVKNTESRKNRSSDVSFDVTTVEISDENIQRIEFVQQHEERFYTEADARFANWYVRKFYNSNGKSFYIDERILGIDKEIGLTDAEILSIREMEVTIDKLPEAVEKIKRLYEQHSKKLNEVNGF